MKEIEKIPSVISDDAVFIGFSPPRTVTYTGIEEMKKVSSNLFSHLCIHISGALGARHLQATPINQDSSTSNPCK